MYCCAWCKNFKDAGKEGSDGFCFIVGTYVRCEDVCDEFEIQKKGELTMNNYEWLKSLDIEELAKIITSRACNCCDCEPNSDECYQSQCINAVLNWLKQEYREPIPDIKVGDVLDVTLEDGAWYDGICVAKGIVYVMSECICKEITEVKIKAISRWSSGSMDEIWRADDEQS